MLGQLSYATEVTALLCMAFFHWRNRTRRSFLLLVLLMGVVAVETVNHFQLLPRHGLALLNGVVVFEFGCYALFYRWSIRTAWHRNVLLAGLVAFLTLAVLNSLLGQSFTGTIQTHTYIGGALLAIVGVLFYFHEVLLVRAPAMPLYKHYYLWVSMGLFLFLAADVPVMMILNYMIEHQISLAEWPVLSVKLIASSMYYLTYALGLAWTRTE